MPPIDDYDTGNTTAVIGALVVFGFVLIAFLSMACHAMCAFCFGKGGACRTPEGGTEESSEGSVYTIEQGIPATAAVMKKKDVQWVQSLSDLGF